MLRKIIFIKQYEPKEYCLLLRTSSIILLFLCIFSYPKAQNLSAYSDYKNYFFVFDDGITKELEYEPIKTYQVGGNSIAYIDNSDNFKAYFNGKKYDLLDVPPNNFYSTDDLLVYFKNSILSVFDKGEITTISYRTNNYIVGDSLVGFFDETMSSFKVYYQGQITEVESAIDKPPFSNFKAGDNTLAYVNYNDHFKVFYHQHVFDLESSSPVSFQAASNTVAYIDGNTKFLKAFYLGKPYILENNSPSSFSVADDMVAYIDNTGSFKIFYQGQTIKLLSFEPSFYEAEDKMVVYYDKGFLSIFYKGKTVQLENFIPIQYQKDFNSFAYRDRIDILKVFYDGELQQISNEKVNSFELTRNVLKFNTGLNNLHFFCKGKIIHL